MGQPCVSESNYPTNVHAFWSCANAMILALLRLVKRSEGHGIRPNSLKVTAISALMTEVIQGNGYSAQIAMEESHFAATAHDMAKI